MITTPKVGKLSSILYMKQHAAAAGVWPYSDLDRVIMLLSS